MKNTKSPFKALSILLALFIHMNLATAATAPKSAVPQASADRTTRLVCATSHLTSSYVLMEDAKKFELFVVHHNGIEMMPIHKGLITIQDLDTLKEDSKIFRKLGERFSIQFAKDQCQVQNQEWFCAKQGEFQVGELNLKNPAFRLSTRSIVTRQVTYDTFSASFSFLVGSIGYSLPMDYNASDCSSHK